ncbi:NAC domain containing protein 28 [Euphorbia peplus]|nr:NAC domain containing protein 28 [Euphorbia peplus]
MAFPGVATPTGFRFIPTDQDLLYFLFKKLTGGSLCPGEAMLVPESNLYGKEEPWKLFDEFSPKYIPLYGSDDLFFFSKLIKKSQNSKNVERRVGITGGTWHREDKGKEVVAEVETDQHQRVLIQGVKKRFKYKNKSSDQHHRWLMSELSLPELNGETVLCRMRKNEDVVANPNKKRPRKNDNVVAKAEAEPPIKRRKLKVKNPELENSAQIELKDDSVKSDVETELNHDDDQAVPEPFIHSELLHVAEDQGKDPIVHEQCVLSSNFEVECGGKDDDDVQNLEHYLENMLKSNAESDLNSENQSQGSFFLNQNDGLVVPEPVMRSNVETELNHDDDQAVPVPIIHSKLLHVAEDHGNDTIVSEQQVLSSDLEVECEGGDVDVQTELLPDNFENYLESMLTSNAESDLNSENQSQGSFFLNQNDILVVPEPVISSQFRHIAEDHDDHQTLLEQPVCSSDFKFEFGDDDQAALLPDNFERYLESDDICFDLFVEPEMNKGGDSRISGANDDFDSFVQSLFA